MGGMIVCFLRALLSQALPLVGSENLLSLEASRHDRSHDFVKDHVVEELDLATLQVSIVPTPTRLTSMLFYLRRWIMCLSGDVFGVGVGACTNKWRSLSFGCHFR